MSDSLKIELRSGSTTQSAVLGVDWTNRSSRDWVGPAKALRCRAGSVFGHASGKKLAGSISVIAALAKLHDQTDMAPVALAVWPTGTGFYAHQITNGEPVIGSESYFDSAQSIEQHIQRSAVKVVVGLNELKGQINLPDGVRLQPVTIDDVLNADVQEFQRQFKVDQIYVLAVATLIMVGGLALIVSKQTSKEEVEQAVYSIYDPREFISKCGEALNFAGPFLLQHDVVEIGCTFKGAGAGFGSSGPVSYKLFERAQNAHPVVADWLIDAEAQHWEYDFQKTQTGVRVSVPITLEFDQSTDVPVTQPSNISEDMNAAFLGLMTGQAGQNPNGAGGMTYRFEAAPSEVLARLQRVQNITLKSLTFDTKTRETEFTIGPMSFDRVGSSTARGVQ